MDIIIYYQHLAPNGAYLVEVTYW